MGEIPGPEERPRIDSIAREQQFINGPIDIDSIIMRKFKRDRKALGAIGGILLFILLLAIVFLGASVGMPFIAKQNVTVGDTMSYDWSVSDNGTMSIDMTVISIDSEELSLNTVIYYNGSVFSNSNSTTDYSYNGNVLMMESMEFFMDSADLTDFNHSYSVALVGYSPMLVDKYTMTELGTTITILIKAGTNMVVNLEIVSDTYSTTMKLTDTSLRWMLLI